ncbi:YhfC family intramembrane metalloprotease [Bacillus niameyensis]|uniref:YhfC family intramembrane metalloprotease n=1 Tax=Bacillus niameyensis TaxID=1522308 RepID=UPI000780C055|nr:YhfC family intramembrane metalloprotease [Bacillus niameyensis]
MVPTSTMIGIIATFLIAVGTPVVLLIFFKRRFNISLKVLLFGMLTFFLFVSILEQIAHGYFLLGNATTKKWFENPWLYMLYGGLMAGLFEETGRFIVMKFALKKFREWKDGLSFGLGHGGFEAISLIGLNSIMMIVYSIMINNGSFDSIMIDDQMRAAMAPIKEQLTTGPSYLIWLGGLERLSAIAIHLGLSVLVLYAITSKKWIYYPLAIVIHALFDFPAALYQTGTITNIFVVEFIILLFAIGAIYWVVKSRKLFKQIIVKE